MSRQMNQVYLNIVETLLFAVLKNGVSEYKINNPAEALLKTFLSNSPNILELQRNLLLKQLFFTDIM